MALYLAEYLLENHGSDPQLTADINNLEIWIIPVMNPDGFDYTWTTYRYWRKNRRDNGDGTFGVDLNRNYDWSWEKGDPTPSSNLYHGTAPFSEPETQALRDLALASNMSVYVAYHTYSQLILYPWGDTYDVPPDEIVLKTMARDMQALIPNVAGGGVPYTVMQSIYLYPAYGVSEDWFYGATGAMSFTLELYPEGPSGGGFYPNPVAIPDVVEDNLWAALYAINAAQDPAGILVDVEAAPASLTVDAGTTATFDVTIHNNAYDPASYLLDVTGVPLTWSKSFPSQVDLPPRSQTTIPLNVTAPWDSAGGNATVKIEASLLGYPASDRTAVDLTVNPITRVVGVDVAAPAGQTVDPGATAVYDFLVTNTGNVEDTFNLAASSASGWPLTAPAQVTVGAGASQAVQVSLDVPSDGQGGTTDDLTLAATSVYDPAYSASDTTTTTIAVVRAVSVVPPGTQFRLPSEIFTLSFLVENGGNTVESFDLLATDTRGWSLVAPGSVGVSPFGASGVDVQVMVPGAALLGTQNAITLRATSGVDLTVWGEASTSVNVLRHSEVTVSAPAQGATTLPGAAVNHTFHVENLGNGPELYLMDASVDLGWAVAGPADLNVPPFSSADVTYEVTVPAGAPAGATGLLTVTASSLYDTTAVASDVIGTAVEHVYGVAVTPPAPVTVDPATDGDEITLAFTVTNTGNGADTFIPFWTVPTGWTGTAAPSTSALGAGASGTITLTVTLEPTTVAGDYPVTLGASSTGGAPGGADTMVTVLRPDLVLAAAEVDVRRVSVGDTVRVTATIRNLGAGTSPESGVSIYLDSEEAPTATATIPGLAPGATGSVTVDVLLMKAGDHTLTIVVDPGNEVVEEDEAPASKEVAVTVVAPVEGTSALPWIALLLLVVVVLILVARWARLKRP